MNLNKNVVEILLVEDNPNDITLTLRALKKHNFANKVFVVMDGEEALDYIYKKGKFSDQPKNENLKVILLDLKLPKIDGLEVLKILKSDENTRSIPVVIMTSSKEEKDLIESYNLGVNSYVTKPIDFNQFIRAVGDIGLYWLLFNELPMDRK